MLKFSSISKIANHTITHLIIYFILSLFHFYLTGYPLSF